ncbi:MAG: hypothetical protein LC725_09785 [Lentisphaerae bacterium]|nr:hypothetical protein [Lentisphaerota bacterium]
MKKILLVTGPGGDAQGWGGIKVTQSISEAVFASGYQAEIVWVESLCDFLRALQSHKYDIVWSALYQAGAAADIVGLQGGDETWLADHLDAAGIPYIGPDAATMRRLIQKAVTHQLLQAAGLAVPFQCLIESGRRIPEVRFPAFVKPANESRSVGISDDSVVHSPAELERQVLYVQQAFRQPALVEDYLSGREYTVLMLGSGDSAEFLPGQVVVDDAHYGRYAILRSDLRGVGLTRVWITCGSICARMPPAG